MSQSEAASGGHEYLIRASQGWSLGNWRDLLNYRDLIFLLVRRDFVSKYKQTVLGPLWFLLQPLLTTGVYIFVFSRAARISTNGLPPALFYLSGLVLWNYFAQSFTGVSQTLLSNVNLFSKVYFPRLVIPIAVMLSNLLAFGIQLALFLGFYLYYVAASDGALRPHGWLWLCPLLLLQTALLSLGLGLLGASLTTKYRDLTHLTTFLIQVGMFLTPIIYPLSVIPEKWRTLVMLNPLAGIIETFRALFFAQLPLSFKPLLFSAGLTLAVLLAGLVAFRRSERTFVDTV